MLEKCIQETYTGVVGKLAKNEVRQAKNIAICVITLASRAAISGGLLPEEAFSMVDGYIQKIEEMRSALKVDAMMRQAEFEFARRVAQKKQSKEKHYLVEKAKNLIFQNLHGTFELREIAEKLGVHQSYLSSLFMKVEGITMQKYVAKEKINLGENLLRYSDYGIQEIASYLSFCSQSHFGSVFKEWTGMTPFQYRKKYGRENIK